MISSPTPKKLKLGDWQSKAKDTVHQAESDGVVVAWHQTTASMFYGYTDSVNPPTTMIARDYGSFGGGFSMPVKKGDFWEVTTADSIFWIPAI